MCDSVKTYYHSTKCDALLPFAAAAATATVNLPMYFLMIFVTHYIIRLRFLLQYYFSLSCILNAEFRNWRSGVHVDVDVCSYARFNNV